MLKTVPLLAYLGLLLSSILLYMLLAQIGLGWVVVFILAGILAGLIIMLRRQSNRPEVVLFHLAQRKYLEEDYTAVVELCTKAVERNPNLPQVYNLMGSSHANMQQYREALGCYQRIAEIQPQNPYAYINIASMNNQLEPVDEVQVVTNLDRAWQLIEPTPRNYNDYAVLLKMAFTEMEIERYPQAIKACSEALRVRPEATAPRMVRGLCTLVEFPDDPVMIEQGRADLISFLRSGFDTQVTLRQEVQFALKAREFLMETGGIPEDLQPRLNNSSE